MTSRARKLIEACRNRWIRERIRLFQSIHIWLIASLPSDLSRSSLCFSKSFFHFPFLEGMVLKNERGKIKLTIGIGVEALKVHCSILTL